MNDILSILIGANVCKLINSPLKIDVAKLWAIFLITGSIVRSEWIMFLNGYDNSSTTADFISS